MEIILGFAPWILYWVLVANDTFESAATAGLVAAGALLILNLAHDRKPKILEIGGLVWFAVLVVVGLTADETFFAHWSYVLSNAALASIVLISILVGHPFARQYGEESVPQEYWGSPVFLQSTLVISWAWFAAMVVMGVSSAFTRSSPSNDLWLDWIIPIGAVVAAIKFTQWYPDHLKAQQPQVAPR